MGVLDLMKASDVLLDNVCLLDPKADKELSPEDGDGRFQWFLFGVCNRFLGLDSCISNLCKISLLDRVS